MNDYVERTINELPMKIVKSDTALTPAGNNLLKKVRSKSYEKINRRVPYLSIKRNICGQDSKTKYSSTGHRVVNCD